MRFERYASGFSTRLGQWRNSYLGGKTQLSQKQISRTTLRIKSNQQLYKLLALHQPMLCWYLDHIMQFWLLSVKQNKQTNKQKSSRSSEGKAKRRMTDNTDQFCHAQICLAWKVINKWWKEQKSKRGMLSEREGGHVYSLKQTNKQK